jgi:hypothetical protein
VIRWPLSFHHPNGGGLLKSRYFYARDARRPFEDDEQVTARYNRVAHDEAVKP